MYIRLLWITQPRFRHDSGGLTLLWTTGTLCGMDRISTTTTTMEITFNGSVYTGTNRTAKTIPLTVWSADNLVSHLDFWWRRCIYWLYQTAWTCRRHRILWLDIGQVFFSSADRDSLWFDWSTAWWVSVDSLWCPTENVRNQTWDMWLVGLNAYWTI